ncbi:hypothetical protein SNEBB_001600 [Seison nebaliae]|nr:hypothetical protein SNEBB_001600 [Seison nebaliae]
MKNDVKSLSEKQKKKKILKNKSSIKKQEDEIDLTKYLISPSELKEIQEKKLQEDLNEEVRKEIRRKNVKKKLKNSRTEISLNSRTIVKKLDRNISNNIVPLKEQLLKNERYRREKTRY